MVKASDTEQVPGFAITPFKISDVDQYSVPQLPVRVCEDAYVRSQCSFLDYPHVCSLNILLIGLDCLSIAIIEVHDFHTLVVVCLFAALLLSGLRPTLGLFLDTSVA